MFKKISLLFLFFFFLNIEINYQVTAQTRIPTSVSVCDDLVKTSGGKVDIWKLGSLTEEANLDLLIECGSPEAAKTQEISPLQIFQVIIDAIAYLAFALSVIAAIVAGIQLATSAGDKSKFETSLTLLKNAGLALVISLSAYAILSAILTQIGFGEWGRPQPSAPVNTRNCGNGTADFDGCRRNFCEFDGRQWIPNPAKSCFDAQDDPASTWPRGFREFCVNACKLR